MVFHSLSLSLALAVFVCVFKICLSAVSKILGTQRKNTIKEKYSTRERRATEVFQFPIILLFRFAKCSLAQMILKKKKKNN